MKIEWYKSENFYDEMFDNDNKINAEYFSPHKWFTDKNYKKKP